MPELPEVETVVRGLRHGGLIGRRVQSVTVHWPRTIAMPSAAEFSRRLAGTCITAVTRRAKYIVMTLSSTDIITVHLRMTGKLLFARTGAPRNPHEHIILALDDGRELRFHDTRKFGRWHLVSDATQVLGHLGPEPLSAAFTPAILAATLRRHRRMLKPLLLDQTVVAGLGNIYVDEALWEAALHPCQSTHAVTTEQAARLHAAIRTVLQRGIRSQGTTLGSGATNFYSVAGRRGRNQDGLMVFRRTGDPCPRCQTPIQRLVVGQRSTHVCPVCQPPPRRRKPAPPAPH
ncbi:MAG: bifunctional DNA-formamidopyrimidine glycosylase/DNA-(apurinic or apyrimidinic site) lyase [Lentisphaerae bacterium]|nr:bifunctional DNA-formamidopyrimidine glycosylase/DNA-(apurinic or apyrimidinic site) lyase [Lentisphaerota bacterium]